MKFLRNLLATIVGLFIFTFLMFVIFVAFIAAGEDDKLVELKDNSVLHLKLNKRILEREVEDPFKGIPYFSSFQEGGIGLIQLKEAIRNASEDDKIEGILLETPMLSAGISSIDEIREELMLFKESGKFLVSYAEMYTEGAYYLASAADEVYLNPDFAMLEFNGLNIQTMHFKGLFDKLEIEPITFSVGDYKGADEPFVRKSMSREVKQRYNGLLSKIYGNILSNVAESRSLSFEEVKSVSDSAKVNLEEEAVKFGLIDELLYRDQVVDKILDKMDLEDEKDLNLVSYGKYRRSFDNYVSSSNRIAVIVANGVIVSGKGDNETIGSAKFAKEIHKAASDKNTKAIVIRINSPGGSALASDVMWREVLLAKEKKPVIASMSSQATSGGYYMAMGCDTIVAQQNTITGSVGVMYMLYNVGDFLGNKLGITTDGVSTGHFSDIFNMTGPLSEYEKAYFQKNANKAYKAFVSKAAEGRGMTAEEFEPFASGRLWSGEEALANGMVDVIGGLEEAIAIAAEAAGVEEDYKTRYYPIQKAPIEEVLDALSGEQESRVMAEKLGDFQPYVEGVKSLMEMKGLQARSFAEVGF